MSEPPVLMAASLVAARATTRGTWRVGGWAASKA